MRQQPWCAIFDWDGVVIDSSHQHELAWERMARERGTVLAPGMFKRSFGMRNDRVIAELFCWTQDPAAVEELSQRKEAYYREIIRREGIEPLPGVRPWLQTARAAGIPLAVGSSTLRANIDCVMQIIQLQGCFDVVVSAEDVTRGKPEPDVFLRAAERLGFAPGACVVFEDAHVGIQAARRAGMKVVGLATTHPAETLTDADRVVTGLAELPAADLAHWFEG